MTVERDLNDDRLDAVLRRVNESLESSWSAPFEELRAGQVWKARWDDVLALVFIDAINDGVKSRVRVAPVEIGVDAADESAVILHDSTNSLSIALSVWPDLVTEIAEVVLERWVAGVHGYDSLMAIEEAAATGLLKRGPLTLNEASSKHRDRMLLGVTMKLLSVAATLPSGTGTLGTLLRTVINGSELVSRVAGILDLEPRLALQILRGDLMISGAQADQLAAALDQDPAELFRANPTIPVELLTTLQAYQRSAPIRQLADKFGIPQSNAFQLAAQGAFALAARGDTDRRDWAGRVDRYLETTLA